ncbi:hypothetical protein [Thermoactinomyces sp. DSM 45892]|uniref:hypothetical protein n=1 Tax=Thermoactinomyces sp. DSM 45892 TaxID=1882753 RepID=UPI000B87BC66|nr:hypothetical protein [Thermoactinomyces sp. DSM 45892]
MKRFLKRSVIIVMTLLLLCSSSISLAADRDPNKLPGAEEQKKRIDLHNNPAPTGCQVPIGKFEECPSSYFKLDYVGKDVGTFDVEGYMEEGINEAFTFIMDLLWSLYTLIVYTVIYFYKFFSVGLSKVVTFADSAKKVLDKSETYLWIPISAWLFTISFIVVVYRFFQGRKTEGYMLLLRNVAIIAFASVFLQFMPTVIKTSANMAETLSNSVLVGFMSDDKTEDTRPDNEKMRDYQRWNKLSAEEKVKEEKKEAEETSIDRVADFLWTQLYFKPYLVLEFGSVENGQKNIGPLFTYGKDNSEDRKDWFRGKGDNNTEKVTDKGKAQPGFEMVTESHMGKRFSYGTVTSLVSIVLCIMLFWYCVQSAKYYYYGVALSMFAIIPLMKAMWYNRNLSELTGWILKIGFAFFMRVIMSLLLAVCLLLFKIMSDVKIDSGGDYGWLMDFVIKNVLTVILFYSLYLVMKESKQQLGELVGSTVPVGSGFTKKAGGFIANKLAGGLGKLKKGTHQAGRLAVAATGKKAWLRENGGISNAIATAQQIKKAENDLTEMGFDPYTEQGRLDYQNHMNEQDAGHEAAATLAKLPYLQKGAKKAETRPQLQANMSSNASAIYKHMKDKGYNPHDPKSREKYLQKNPNNTNYVEEIAKWTDLPVEQRVSGVNANSLPPSRPESGTPEASVYYQMKMDQDQALYDRTADQLIQTRKREYSDQKQAHQAQSILKRTFAKKPQYQHPGQEDITQAYLKAKHARNDI